MKHDPDVVMAAKQNGLALEYAHELKSDEEIVMAIKQNGNVGHLLN